MVCVINMLQYGLCYKHTPVCTVINLLHPVWSVLLTCSSMDCVINMHQCGLVINLLQSIKSTLF